MNKIIFLIPPVIEGKVPERLFGCSHQLYPSINIGMLQSAAVLEKNGYTVGFIDCPVENRKDFPMDTDIYVFYNVFLAKNIDLFWANKILKTNKNTKIIWIGPEPTRLGVADDYLINESCFICRGETEKTILELLKEFDNKNPNYEKILGLSWRKEGKIIHNPFRPLMTNEELDQLPFPSRHLIKNPERYKNPKFKKGPTTVAYTSRNCWGRCWMCLPSSLTFAREIEHKNFHNFQKPPCGLFSPKRVIEEFKEIKRLGYRSVLIADDSFIFGKQRLLDICNGIKDLGLEWGCLLRADTLKDDEMAEAMKESGCSFCDIGLESFSQDVLDYIKKDMKVEDNIRAIDLLRRHGIQPKINILLGACPLETEDMIKNTVEKLIEMDLDYVSFAIVLPHPETEFYKTCKKNKWFATGTEDYTPASPLEEGTVSFPNGLSNKDYERLLKWCYRRIYLRPSFIWSRLKNIRNLKQLKEDLRTAWNLVLKR